MTETMIEYLSWGILLICVVVSVVSTSAFFFSKDKGNKKRVWRFIYFKGILYFILAVGSTVYDLLINQNFSPATVLTICIAFLETTQNIITVKSEQYYEEADELMEKCNSEKDTRQKDIEKIFVYCSEKLQPLKRPHATLDDKKLAYEQIHDYLKYYLCAEEFFVTFDRHMKNQCDIQAVDESLCEVKKNLEMYATEIVKIPQ